MDKEFLKRALRNARNATTAEERDRHLNTVLEHAGTGHLPDKELRSEFFAILRAPRPKR